MSKEKPWDNSWEYIRDLSKGGQGKTVVVRRRASVDSAEYVLKVLHRPGDIDRRERLKREIRALRSVDLVGVPRVADANDNAADQEPLFMVTELVPGHTLETRLIQGALNLDDALDLATALVEIVRAVHKGGVLHRDIKPDNIVLRSEDHRQPVLLDFGLSASEGDDKLTATEQQVGNRFLILPELHTPHDDKRNIRSDLTYCCGILFCALTGSQPMTLRDGDGAPPHRRSVVQEAMHALEPPRLVALARLFDVGFSLAVSDRFKDADELLAAIQQVRSPAPKPAIPPPSIGSLWTLHAVKGVPDSLYFHHRLTSGGDIADFFKGNLPPAPINTLTTEVQHAMGVLWNEVADRGEVRRHFPSDAPFKRAFDHVNHILDQGWASVGASTEMLTWNREYELPNERKPGPRETVPIQTLSAAGRSAVLLLDDAARRSAQTTLSSAEAAKAAWEKGE